MRIGFRADASVMHGAGHVMRCLTLAVTLRAEGGNIFFISRELPGNLCDLIEKKGFTLYRLPYENQRIAIDQLSISHSSSKYGVLLDIDVRDTVNVLVKNRLDLDWLIVDGYEFNRDWEERIRPLVNRIMVIDDMANRLHDFDLLLDQNLHKNYKSRYDRLVPPLCQKMLGPQYALLRQEFRELRMLRRPIDKPVHRVSIFFSGSDPENETKKALKAMKLVRELRDIEIDVIVGSANLCKEDIRRFCESSGSMHFYCQVENMASLMTRADFAVGAAGSASWERCCLGLPAMVTVLSEDQLGIAEALGEYGAVLNMGWYSALTVDDYVHAIEILDVDQLKEMALKGMNLVDGFGAVRVVKELLKSR